MQSNNKLLVLAVALAVLAACPLGATNLPPGFEESAVITFFGTNIAQFDFTPDGNAFIGDKSGLLWFWGEDDDEKHHVLTPLAPLPVDDLGERGISGIAVDPDYLTNGHVWIYYTTQAPIHNRLSRFTWNGKELVDETPMIDGPLTVQTDHNSGGMRFATDKTLFLAMGEDRLESLTAQDPFDLRGKILHINRDGTPAADNPFLDGVAGHPLVWAMGLRNPYRIAIQPETDNLFIGDVGFTKWEEINLGFPGANFGWAEVEGPDPPGQPYVYPIYTYSHNGVGAAIIAGDFVPEGAWSPEFEGNFFYAEFVQKELYRVVLDDTNTVTNVELFATDFGRTTDMRFGPGGGFYYVCRSCNPAELRRIDYIGGSNRQPVARATATPDSGAAPLTVQLDAGGSSDADDDPLTFDWSLGDDSSSTAESLSKEYPAGVYTVELEVTDDEGASDVAIPLRIVSGNSRPTAAVSSPVDETPYIAGQEINFAGAGSDPEEGAIDCDQFTWQVVFHHNTHTHPFLGPTSGSCSGSFTVPFLGERDPDQWFEVRLTVEDEGVPLGAGAKLSGSHAVQIRPVVSVISLRSAPLDDLQLKLDTTPFQPPRDVSGVVAQPREVEAVDLQLGSDGNWYRWIDWSDGGDRAHTISTPAEPTTYTANFDCVPDAVTGLVVAPATPGQIELTWSPAPPACLGSGAEKYRVYSAPTAVPADPAGPFPTATAFTLAGTSAVESLLLTPEPGLQFFLVVPVSPQLNDGRSGHYGF